MVKNTDEIFEHSVFSKANHTYDSILYDFDGVLADGLEDAIYKLPEIDSEKEVLITAAKNFGISTRIYEKDIRYLRHLVFQEAAYRAQKPIKPGPLLEQAMEKSNDNIPIFIVTARSGPSAIRRMLDFLSSHGLVAQEIFCVGRVSKTSQISYVLKKLAVRHVYFFDDSGRHISNAKNMKGDRVSAHQIKSSNNVRQVELRRYFMDVLTSADKALRNI